MNAIPRRIEAASDSAAIADGYVVVSLYRDPKSVVYPYRRSYAYDDYKTLKDAVDYYADLERGEHRCFAPVGIFPVRNGMPCGDKIDGARITKIMRET